MKLYRLKPEAVKFFKEKYATCIYTFDTWEDIGVDLVALDEVEKAYLTFGHKTSENSSSLSGWDADKGGHYQFTIHFPSEKFEEHDRFKNGKVIRELMDSIQNQINYFYSDFNNN